MVKHCFSELHGLQEEGWRWGDQRGHLQPDHPQVRPLPGAGVWAWAGDAGHVRAPACPGDDDDVDNDNDNDIDNDDDVGYDNDVDNDYDDGDVDDYDDDFDSLFLSSRSYQRDAGEYGN